MHYPYMEHKRANPTSGAKIETYSVVQYKVQGELTKSFAMIKVLSENLDPNKSWFILNSALCGKDPYEVARNVFFKKFPSEIQNVDPRELRCMDGNPVPSGSVPKPNKLGLVSVVSSFGLACTLLRQKDLSPVKSMPFVREVQVAINKQDGGIDDSKDYPSTPVSKLHPLSSSTPLSSNTSSSGEERSISSVEDDPTLRPATKRRRTTLKARSLFEEIDKTCRNSGETMGTVLSYCCLRDPSTKENNAREVIKAVMTKVSEEKGVKKCFELLLPDECWEERVAQMRVPDWQLLLLKLEARISDCGWQTLLNRTNLGRTGVRVRDLFIMIRHIIMIRKFLDSIIRSF